MLLREWIIVGLVKAELGSNSETVVDILRRDGEPFIIAYIVMNESAADDAKLAESGGCVDDTVNTVRAAQQN